MTKKYLLWFVFAVAFGLRLWHVNWGLPELYEEAFPFAISWKFWNWGQPGLDFNPHFFNYPAFTFYLNFFIQSGYFLTGSMAGLFPDLAAFQKAYEIDPTAFIVLSRCVSIFFDMGTILVLYKSGKEMLNESAGILAAALGAITPLLIKQSHLSNVDTPLTLFSILSLLLLYRLYKTSARKWYILSGISMGLAASSKYNGALLLPVLFAVHFFGTQSKQKSLRLKNQLPLVQAIIVSGIVFLIWNPFVLLNFDKFYHDFRFEEMHMEAGHLGANPTETTWEFYFLSSLPHNIGWGLLCSAAVSMIYIIQKRKKSLLALTIFPLIYLTIICTWNMRADRYALPVIPPLILLASIGVVTFWNTMIENRMKSKFQMFFQSRLVRVMAVVATGLILFIQPVVAVIAYHRSFALPDTRVIAKNWIVANLARGSIIGTIQMGIDIPDTSFRIFPIPFLAVNAEKVAPFYDTRWYEDFDLIVGSSFDYDRYALDSVRYKDFLAYYDSLRTRWKLALAVVPKENQSGPSIWLYQPYAVPKDKGFAPDLLERLKSAPESSRVSNFLTNMAKAVFQKGNVIKAEQVLREIVSVEILNMDARRSLINLLGEQGRFTEALVIVREYLQINPNNASMLWLEGNIQLRLNNVIAAETSLKQALRLDTRLSAAYDDLLFIYVQRRDKQKAIDVLSRHLGILPPGSEKARLVASDLNNLRNMP